MSDLNKMLQALGQRLKQARIARNDSQVNFAFRIGVSTPTLHKMETGSPNVGIGKWLSALNILGCETDFNKLIAPKTSFAEQFKAQQEFTNRQRIKRKR